MGNFGMLVHSSVAIETNFGKLICLITRKQECSVGGAGGASLPHYKFKGDRRSLTLT